MSRDRRFCAHNIYMPARKNEGIDLAAFIDTSGSIGDDEISKFKTELVGMCRQFESIKMALGFCDSKVHSVLKFDNVSENDIMEARPSGGGGTDMRKCIKWVSENNLDVPVVVILTDGHTPFPTKADVPSGLNLLWLIVPDGIDVAPENAYGKFIFMRRD
jgi:predicted metal-dependent peptidase